MPAHGFISLAAIGLVAICGCGDASNSDDPLQSSSPRTTGVEKTSVSGSVTAQQPEPMSSSIPRFLDVRESLGLSFVFNTGADGHALMVESTGGGGGWIDFDRDGWCDFYGVQAGPPIPRTATSRSADRNAMFRNTGQRFVDVSQATGTDDSGYGQGLAVGDYDNDGFPDLYVTNVGANTVYRNLGDGTFENVTVETGTGDQQWGTSAAWGDLDGDGNLDLYVCNYLKYDPAKPPPCRDKAGNPATCHPEHLDAESNVCFRNLGDGEFVPVTSEWALDGEGGKSLGVAVLDLNGDGLPDVFVANDTTANFLFLNEGEGHFSEQAIAMGCGLSGQGQYQASMGIAAGDYDENGYPDLYVTHFTHDSNTMYANLGPGGFYDSTRTTGLHTPTIPYLAFGACMTDFNADGRLDLFIANGHIDDWRDRGELLEMPAQLFTFDGQRWGDVGAQSGNYFNSTHIGRSASTCDFDNDGDLDLAIVHQQAEMSLLRNEQTDGHWLNVRLVGRVVNRDAIAASIIVQQGDRQLICHRAGGTSYCASHDSSLFVGLGENDSPCVVTVRWTRDRFQRLEAVAVDQTITIVESY